MGRRTSRVREGPKALIKPGAGGQYGPDEYVKFSKFRVCCCSLSRTGLKLLQPPLLLECAPEDILVYARLTGYQELYLLYPRSGDESKRNNHVCAIIQMSFCKAERASVIYWKTPDIYLTCLATKN